MERDWRRDDSRLFGLTQGTSLWLCDAAWDVCKLDTSCEDDTRNTFWTCSWDEHQGRVLLLQTPHPASCMTKFYKFSPPHACFPVLSSPTLAVCVAKWMDRILKDAYIKVTKRRVRIADSAVIKWIIHAGKIDVFAAEAFNKLVTLRGSEIETKPG